VTAFESNALDPTVGMLDRALQVLAHSGHRADATPGRDDLVAIERGSRVKDVDAFLQLLRSRLLSFDVV
jgi:hypothetical protein